MSSVYGQSFCLEIGDGVVGGGYEKVTAMIGSGTDIAFVGWDGYYFEDMHTMVGKITHDGNLLWMRSFNTMDSTTYGRHELATSLIEAANGDLLFSTNNGTDAAVTRCNGANGNLIRSRVYDDMQIAELFELPNGNIIMFGNANEDQNPSAVLLDANLNVLNGTTLGMYSVIKDVIKTSTGYYGVILHPTYFGPHLLIFSLTNSMAVNWVRRYDPVNGSLDVGGLVALPDGSVIVASCDGICSPTNNGRITLQRYGSNGTLLNTKIISSPGSCLRVMDILLTPSGNLILAGDSNFGKVTLAFGPNGSFLGAQINNSGHLWGMALARNSEGAIYLGGTSTIGRNEGMISRLDPSGASCCSSELLCTVMDVAQTEQIVAPSFQVPVTPTSVVHGTATDWGSAYMVCGPAATKSTAGEAAQSSAAAISVSPNPAQDRLQVVVPGEAPAAYTLHDLQGRLLASGTLRPGSQSLPVADFARGVYVLRVTNDQLNSTHRISLQH